MAWNRKEVGGLLMVGVGIISAIQTAFFTAWVDAKTASNNDVAKTVALVGIISMLILSSAWFLSRFYMARMLTGKDKLDWRVAATIITTYAAIETGWVLAYCY